MKYKIGQIVFFRYNNIYMKLVTLHNLIKHHQIGFNHVGIITEVNKDDVVIHEAVNQGFLSSSYPKDRLDAIVANGTAAIAETKIPLKRVKEIANSPEFLGKPYGWLDIVSIAISTLTGFSVIGVTGAKYLICSEAVARILYDASDKQINFETEYYKDYDLITPMDIYLSNQIRLVS